MLVARAGPGTSRSVDEDVPVVLRIVVCSLRFHSHPHLVTNEGEGPERNRRRHGRVNRVAEVAIQRVGEACPGQEGRRPVPTEWRRIAVSIECDLTEAPR